MRIRIIYPVTGASESVIEEIENYAKKYLLKDTIVEIRIIDKGFMSIETEAQGIINGASILEKVLEAEKEGVDGIFIYCFDDPAVVGAREMVSIPVIGPYESAISFSQMLCEKTAIISTDRYGIACEERKANHHNLKSRIGEITCLDVGVLDFNDRVLIEKICKCCKELEEKGVSAAVLGCGSMAGVADIVRRKLKEENYIIQIIEPIAVGLIMLESIIRLGFTNAISATKIKMDQLLPSQK